tara:strand:+ start:14767 stop:15438 length:672 start_codon:yes stop_codon:yes gene_type:complete
MTDKPTSLLAALAKALPELGGAKKTAINPHFKSNYADLLAVIEAIRPIAAHGLWWRQIPVEASGGVGMETFYLHASGELSAGVVVVPVDKANAQGYGSAMTYARRYGLTTAFGLATEDDDGNAAADSPPPTYEFPDGPAANITSLKSMTRGLWRDVAACGDDDMLVTLLEAKESQALMAQLDALENPGHRRELWEGDGKDNPGLSGLIENQRLQFKADLLQAG